MKGRESILKNTPAHSRAPSVRSRLTKSFIVNVDDLAEPLVVVPPDGGWGWVVVAAGFTVVFWIDGIGYCFALFFEELSKDLHCKVTEVALSTSLLGGFYYLSGPLTCSATNRFGFQIVGFLGGMVSAAAFMAATYIQSLLYFLILVSAIGGTAFNLLYTPSLLAMGFYFERWRALAMAIYCCGSSVGILFAPLIWANLLKKFHWRTKFQIMAGIFALCGVLSLAYKPIKPTKIERVVQFGEVSQKPSSLSVSASEKELGGLAGFFQRFKNALFPTISEVSLASSYYPSRSSSRHTLGYDHGYLIKYNAEIESTSMFTPPYERHTISQVDRLSEESHESDEERQEIGCCKKCRDSTKNCCSKYCICFACCCSREPRVLSFSNVNRPMYREDIFYSGSVYRLPKYSKSGTRSAARSATSNRIIPSLYTMSVSRAPTQRDLLQQRQCVCCPEAIVRVLVTMFHYEMLKSITFLTILISGYFSLASLYICFTYIVSRGVENGIDEQLAVLLLSVLGISNSVGRVACGVVSCVPAIDVTFLSAFTLLIAGGMAIGSVFMVTFYGQIIFCCIFGFTYATLAVLRPIMFVELFGLENLTNCFGLNMIFNSLAAFTAIPMANFIYTRAKSFDAIFVFVGVITIVSALLLVPVKCILMWEKTNVRK